VLAFAGLFVAGSLSVTKLFHLELPCGASHGCDIVNSHPSSRWFGVPVAYIGFFGYLIIAVLALMRAPLSPERARPLALYGYLISAFGALTSVALQIYSLAVIQATCLWCLTSATLMVLLLIFHALEYGDRVAEDTPQNEDKGAGKLAMILGALVLVGLIGMKLSLQRAAFQKPTIVSADKLAKADLIPKDAHSFGDPSAPITVVEFADLMCPSCQRDSPILKEFINRHAGKVRMVYRHYPIEQLHPLGAVAAAISEVAADQGKFWDFTVAVMATNENIKDVERVWEIAKGVGLDEDKVKARLNNPDDPALARLLRDKNAANALGITSTPTFIVKAKGLETQVYGFPGLMDALQNGVYKGLVEGK
jgi:protein-disulfide isomerase